jgi:hypothetical protein
MNLSRSLVSEASPTAGREGSSPISVLTKTPVRSSGKLPEVVEKVPSPLPEITASAAIEVPEGHRFVSFLKEVDPNNRDDVLEAIRECDAVREVLRSRYVALSQHASARWA